MTPYFAYSKILYIIVVTPKHDWCYTMNLSHDLLYHLDDFLDGCLFKPMNAWMPFSLSHRADFVKSPGEHEKWRVYSTQWFKFWNPTCISKDRSLFDVDWNKVTWTFVWNMGFSHQRMMCTCVRFEEVMLTWYFIISEMRTGLGSKSFKKDIAIHFMNAAAACDHCLDVLMGWVNLDNQLRSMPEFSKEVVESFKNVNVILCHACLLLPGIDHVVAHHLYDLVCLYNKSPSWAQFVVPTPKFDVSQDVQVFMNAFLSCSACVVQMHCLMAMSDSVKVEKGESFVVRACALNAFACALMDALYECTYGAIKARLRRGNDTCAEYIKQRRRVLSQVRQEMGIHSAEEFTWTPNPSPEIPKSRIKFPAQFV